MANRKMNENEASSNGSNLKNGRAESIVVDIGRQESACRYCKSGFTGTKSDGCDYQDLLDKGWRRYDCYFLHKPVMEKTCCPSYTMRLKASDFVPSKEQKRAVKQMQKFMDSTMSVKKRDVVAEKVAISKDSSLSGGISSNLEIRLNRSCFDPEEYALYKKYMIKVHNHAPDQDTESSYRKFLVDTPVIYVPSSGDSTTPLCGFGTFHQQYLIDGKLVAVGVVDILPTCLSSKYVFWDPDLTFLSLGKYITLQQINWVRETQRSCPSLQYYHPGYYVHSCKKMAHKATFSPSELLCPLRYQWVPFDNAKRLLDKKPYVVLSDFATLQSKKCSSLNVTEEHMKQPGGQPCLDESKGILVDVDEEMSKLDF